MEEEPVAPRVLVVQVEVDTPGIEQAFVGDGDAAVSLLGREPFDAVVLDVSAPPLDGWVLLATLAAQRSRPRVVVVAAGVADRCRAAALRADVCVSGTDDVARVLRTASKEQPCLPSPVRSFRAPMTSGVSA
jgi:DNA-binding response OmpR family regulator